MSEKLDIVYLFGYSGLTGNQLDFQGITNNLTLFYI